MAKATHKTRLLDYLVEHQSITSLEAIRDLGNTRLAATVHQLRRNGHDIISQPTKVKTRWGTETEIAKYILQTPFHTN